MKKKEYRARVAELETENMQLKARLYDEIAEVENLQEIVHALKDEHEARLKRICEIAVK